MSRKLRWIVRPVLVILANVIVFTAVSRNEQEPSDIPQAAEVTQEQSERPALPTMFELGSEECIPCEQMKPVMAKLTEEHGELIHIEFHDVRKEQVIARQNGIRLIPTQIFLDMRVQL